MTLPDTGSRSEFETGAVRDACSGKGLPSRIPPEAIRRLAKRYEDGEAKYPDADGVPNWMRGIPLSRYFDSAMRHLLAAAEGDTSEDHLGAVLWNAAGWIWTEDAIAAGRLPSSLDALPFARAERAIQPGDRVHVTDTDGPGEPYEFTSVVESVSGDGILTTHSSTTYRKDQVTLYNSLS